jgi:uncharacterized protein YjiS (DUF1127 family)
MNRAILIPRRRSNPGLLVRLARAIGNWRKKRAAYNHFRRLNCTHEQARDLAERVL